MKPIIQSAINISTSDSKVVRDMVNRLSLIPGLIMADASSDVDHNRTVISLLGNEKSLPGGVRVIFEIALQTIDISHHQGEHPRMGAVDVVPFTPWGGV
ncbi:MAG: glutamate formimidoyltransferase, partial [Candidatus Atribacteria bacterium]|nr:glutamate formimidoyltransferase [Candidatus Atribacteria bacterium]